ncbi:MAG: hypothetical protein ACNFW9_04915 [Candidatus Kerfeldbacteria bacterium]|jgi:FlaA1/EpsC-like NDP-sugar epimerase
MLDFWSILGIIIIYTFVLFALLRTYAKFKNNKLAILIIFGFLVTIIFFLVVSNLSDLTNSKSMIYVVIGVYSTVMIIYQILFRKLIKQANKDNNYLDRENN